RLPAARYGASAKDRLEFARSDVDARPGVAFRSGMAEIFDILVTRTWWSWVPGDRSWHSLSVHWFNLFEGAAWWSFGTLVFRRFLRNRKSRLEPVYAAAFFAFGV